MSKLPWFRLYAEMPNDERIEEIAFEDRWHYVNILCMKCAGLLDKKYRDDGMRERKVARELGVDTDTAKFIKTRLFEVGLIDEFWMPIAWDKRQFVSDHDISGAERQRRFRERQKAEKQGKNNSVTLRNGRVTLPDTEADTEADADTEAETECSSDDKRINFDEFWHWYPRKTNKQKARLKWDRMPIADQRLAIRDAPRRYATTEKQFIPHPTTYLNGKRWEDEIITETRNAKLSGSQQGLDNIWNLCGGSVGAGGQGFLDDGRDLAGAMGVDHARPADGAGGTVLVDEETDRNIRVGSIAGARLLDFSR